MKIFKILFLVLLIGSSTAVAQLFGIAFRQQQGSGYDLDFDYTVASPSLDSSLAFTRSGSIGSYHNSSGTIVYASANQPRYDYDPVSLTMKGLLMEPASTNLIDDSSFAGGSWYDNNAPRTANQATAPDGTNTATKIEEAPTSCCNAHQAGYVLWGLSNNVNISTSFFAKAGTVDKISVYMSTKNTVYGDITFVLTGSGMAYDGSEWGKNGVVSDYGIIPYPNGWYRIWLISRTGTTANGLGFQPRIWDMTNTSNYYGSGAGGRYYYIWGAQVERTDSPTSYIPTSGGTATRNVESLNFANMSWYNATEGTLFAQYVNRHSGDNTRLYNVFGVSATSVSGTYAQNLITVADRGVTSATGVSAASATVFMPAASVSSTDLVNKSALAYKAADFAMSVNGSAASTQASGSLPTTPTVGYIGSQPNAMSRPRWIQKIKYFNIRKTNAEVQALTQ